MREYLYIPLCELATHLKSIVVAMMDSVKMMSAFIITYIMTLLSPFCGLLVFTSMLVIFDWIFAMGYAIKNKCVDSKKRWKLVSKITAYFVFFFVIGGIDKYAPYLDGMTDIFVAIILLKECVSIFANMKMLFPNVKMLDLLEGLFQNEMNRKMTENRQYTENDFVQDYESVEKEQEQEQEKEKESEI